MFLGIEIGGTKLQVGVGRGDGTPLEAFQRAEVDRIAGAEAILAAIARIAPPLIDLHAVRGIGIGFGGPVDVERGRMITSHQVDGWDDRPLVA